MTREQFRHTENNSTWTVTLVDGLVEEKKLLSYQISMARENLVSLNDLVKAIRKASKGLSNVTLYRQELENEDGNMYRDGEIIIQGFRPMTSKERKSYELHVEHEPLRKAAEEARQKAIPPKDLYRIYKLRDDQCA